FEPSSSSNALLSLSIYFIVCAVNHSFLQSSPTRRSSDLPEADSVPCGFRTIPRELPEIERPHRDENVTPPFKYVPERRSIPHESDRKSTRLNSSHVKSSYAVFCLKKKK